MSKKIILASLVAGMAASSALAVEKAPTVTLGGSLDTQIGYRNEKGVFKYIQNNALLLNTTGGKRHTTAIVNDTRVNVGIDGKAHGMSYGGRIVLNADTSANKFANQDSSKIGYATMAYTESHLGRIEAGNTTSVYDAMSVSAADVARASGGASAGDAQYWVNPIVQDATGFISQEGFFSNLQTGGSDHAAKVSYYTPTYGGLKLAVSYTPDMEQKGTAAVTHLVSSQVLSNNGNTITNAFKNVVTGAATYEGKSNNVGIKVGVSGERGSAKRNAAVAGVVYKKLSSAQAGLQLSYNGFSAAGSYANLGKSGQARNVPMKASTYWTAGLGYDYNKLGASVTYFASKKGANYTNAAGNNVRKFNKSTNWSVGADYKLAPGFLPYVEYTNFNYKYANPTLARNRGNVVLAGTKLQF